MNLELSQTDQYAPNPRPRIKLREWHLTAAIPEPVEKAMFVALFRVRRAATTPLAPAGIAHDVAGARVVLLKTPGGDLTVTLPHNPDEGVKAVLEEEGSPRAKVRE